MDSEMQDPDYLIEQDNTRLTRVDKRIVCTCGCVLALENEGALFIKTHVTIVNKRSGSFTLRCGECKRYTEYNGVDNKLVI